MGSHSFKSKGECPASLSCHHIPLRYGAQHFFNLSDAWIKQPTTCRKWWPFPSPLVAVRGPKIAAPLALLPVLLAAWPNPGIYFQNAFVEASCKTLELGVCLETEVLCNHMFVYLWLTPAALWTNFPTVWFLKIGNPRKQPSRNTIDPLVDPL